MLQKHRSSKQRPICLAIADDHPIIVQGIQRLFESHRYIRVTLDAPNGTILMDKLRTAGTLPQIVVLDISMPEMDGYRTAQLLHQEHPHIRILALSMHKSPYSITKMKEAGASGFVLKDAAADELENAILAVAAGEDYFPAATGYHSHKGFTLSENGIQLTEKEIEYLHYCREDLSYKAIAHKMCVSIYTLYNYRDSLYRKLRVNTRAGLIQYANNNGITANQRPA